MTAELGVVGTVVFEVRGGGRDNGEVLEAAPVIFTLVNIENLFL